MTLISTFEKADNDGNEGRKKRVLEHFIKLKPHFKLIASIDFINYKLKGCLSN